MAKLVDEALEKYGRLDIFFANAGIAPARPVTIPDATAEDFMKVMRTNALGLVCCDCSMSSRIPY